MRCPSCDHMNSNLATRCSACGSELPRIADATEPEATNDPFEEVLEGVGEDPDGLSGNEERVPVAGKRRRTVLRPYVEVESPQHTDDSQTQGNRKSSVPRPQGRRVGSFLKAHQRGIGIAIAVIVAAALAAVWAFGNFTNTPSFQLIERDMRERMPNFSYAGGTFGSDFDIPVSGVAVTRRERTETPANMLEAVRKGSSAWFVEAELTYDNERVRIVRNVSATYVNGSDGWTVADDLNDLGTAVTALSGIDEEKIVANMGEILTAVPDEGALASLYANGSFQVQSSDFEAASEGGLPSDSVVVACATSSSFSSSAGTLYAHFSFDGGIWQLTSAEADQGMYASNYDPLIGTWSGTFIASDADRGVCYGAGSHPLTVTILSIDEDGQTVEGVFSGLAHYHARLAMEAREEVGDTFLEDVPFMGAISTTYNAETQSSLNIACLPVDDSYRDVILTLNFGTDSDPNAALARLTTSYSYEELMLMLIPRITESRFTDTYQLTRL